MRFSSKEQYGLRAMAQIARHYDQGPVSLSDVAEAEGISLPYLEHIAAELRQAGLLKSRRGAYGGYMLARPPKRISLGDVIRVLEGSLVQMPCIPESSSEREAGCERRDVCVTRGVWLEVYEKLAGMFDSLTLADLIGEKGATPKISIEEEMAR